VAPVLQNIRGIWQRAGLAQQILLVAVVLGGIGAAVLLVNWARQPRMALLYARLDPEEAAKIVEKIRDADVPCELKAGGTSIYVPEDKVYSLRLDMASEGLTTGGQGGYGILDSETIGTSPFKQSVNYVRAIEGELAKSIQLIDGVSMARVHVVKPKDTLFAGKEKQASATVVLKLKSGWRLTDANVAAIVNLVAGGVEGLTAEKVVVVDSDGNLLTSGGDNQIAKQAGSLLDYKTRVEQYLARKAEEMLTAVLGPGRASVRVDATIETSSSSTVEEKYQPDSKVVTSEKLRSSSTAGSPRTGAAAPGSTSTEEETETAYLTPKTVTTRTELPGQVKALTVAALVDVTGPAKEGGSGEPLLKLEDAKEIIRSAIGAKPEDVTVVAASFPQADAAEEAPAEEGLFTKDFLLDMARRSSLGLLVIGFLLALKMFRGKKKVQLPNVALEGRAATQGAMLPGGEDAAADPNVLRAHISRALQDNPDEVKRLFLTWAEGRKGES